MEKKSKGKTIVIVILVLLILGLGGYIVYDKIIFKEKTEPIKVEKEKENGLLNKDEALEIGKERYEYVRDGLYYCGYEKVKTDVNKAINVIDGVTESGDKFLKIINITDIKSNLTMHTYIDWLKEKNIHSDGDDYYISLDCEGNPQYAKDKYQINIKKINEDSIVYSISEYFYIVDNEGNIVDDINQAEEIITSFELVKESNKWKIKEYTDAQDVYYNKL